MYDFEASALLRQRGEGERTLTVPFMLVSVFLIVFASSFGQSVLLSPVLLILYGGKIAERLGALFASGSHEQLELQLGTVLDEATAELMSTSLGLVAQLLSAAVVIALTVVFCVCLERRSVATMGLTRRRAPLHYGLGLLIGAAVFALAYLICVLFGALRPIGINRGASAPMFVLLFFGYVIQGASEELLMRGFLMLSLARRYSLRISIFASSVFFSLMHIANAGVTVIGLLNVFLFGVFASLYTLRSQSLVGTCAIHTAWNFVEGNVFGCSVSGFLSTDSIFLTQVSGKGLKTSGGAFGPEGGFAVTLVLIFALLAVCLLPSRRKQDKENRFEA